MAGSMPENWESKNTFLIWLIKKNILLKQYVSRCYFVRAPVYASRGMEFFEEISWTKFAHCQTEGTIIAHNCICSYESIIVGFFQVSKKMTNS